MNHSLESKTGPKKVAVGMSGGVDSSLSAALLKEQGYEVTGVFLECWRGPGCRAEEDRKDALDVALQLGIPFEVLDYRQEYKQAVVDYFYREYKAGRTPNPDVMCNKEIKFGMFYDWALGEGFDYVATGHYARVGRQKLEDGEKMFEWRLMRGVDEKKDQSYFLYRLREEQLAHILFPIGHLTKPEVRLMAEERSLPVAGKPDSQGICFIGEVSVVQFLKDLGMEEKEGEVFMDEEVVGRHRGAWFYTIGQRHGFELDKKKLKQLGLNAEDLPAFYVVEKEVEENRLVVGARERLYRQELKLEEVHLINGTESIASLQNDHKLKIRIRHGGEMVPVKQLETSGDGLKLRLEKPVFGAAPGQAVVFYRGEACLGGGIIAG